MKNFIELTISGTLAFILSMCIIPLMRVVAQKLKLVDVPISEKYIKRQFL
jgi:UDP-GlcNAc:undecaprenyl-phosphate GlcNAc-1-phosphate transferase